MKIANIATPAEIDHMPKEVATALLTEPKARLSNRERKTCKAARETVYLSTSPIVREEAKLFYTGQLPKDPEKRLGAKLTHATYIQLLNWIRRTDNRRTVAQRVYTETNERIEKEANPRRKSALRQLANMLVLRVQVLDLVWEACTAEKEARDAKTASVTSDREKINDEIDPRKRRQVALKNLLAKIPEGEC